MMQESAGSMSCRTIETRGTATIYRTELGSRQVYVTAAVNDNPDPVSATADAYRAIADLLAEGGLQTVQERIFGALASHSQILEARAAALEAQAIASRTPLTYIQGRPLFGEGLAGVSLFAVRAEAPEDVWTIADADGTDHGRGWKCHDATFLLLQDVHGRADEPGADNSRAAQADRMFDRADQLLRSQRRDYRSVTRTWVYLSEILDWYDEFNQVRSAKYGRFGLMPEAGQAGSNHLLLPASTGIQGDTPRGAAVTMDVLATEIPEGSPIEIRQMTNRRQRDAFKYGSAFSRGAAIRMPEATWISLSGTASIDESGATLRVGDTRGQIQQTFDVVEALIAQEGAALTDLCDATIFIKQAEDADVLAEVIAERGLKELAGVRVVADVCRDDLLFEIDGAAVVQRG